MSALEKDLLSPSPSFFSFPAVSNTNLEENEYQQEVDSEDSAPLIRKRTLINQQDLGFFAMRYIFNLVDAFDMYDQSFLVCISFQYFLSGFKILMDLSVIDFFKAYLHLEPSRTQLLHAIIAFPWALKIIFGIVSDSFPLFGSRKRSYYILNSVLSMVFLFPLVIPYFMREDHMITFLLFMQNACLAFNDVITDSIIVQQSRLDPDTGAQNLNAYARTLMTTGGIMGAVTAAYLTQYTNPHVSFFIQCFLSMFIVWSGFNLSARIDQDFKETREETSWKEFLKNVDELRLMFTYRPVMRTLAYFIVVGLMIPNFNDVNYYFQLEVVNFSKFTYSMLQIVSQMSGLIGVSLYSLFFRHWHFRSLLATYYTLGVIQCVINLFFALRVNHYLGIEDLKVAITLASIQPLKEVISIMCFTVLFNKLSPHHIEASAFATFTSLFNLAESIMQPYIGSVISAKMHVDNQHLDKYSRLVFIQLGCWLLGYCYIFIISKNEFVEETYRQMRVAYELEEQHHRLRAPSSL